jgi:ribonuclease E
LPPLSDSFNGNAAAPGQSHEAALDAGDAAPRRPEAELVAVPMQPEQELVYGWLGLNPALLLDPVPSTDNLVVRVVRPGDDAEAVLEEARQQLAAAGPRRRRRGRGGQASEAPAGAPETAAAAPLPVTVEITPLPVTLPPDLAETEPVSNGRSGRSTRSRSRSSSTAAAAVTVTEPVLAVEPVAAPAEPDTDDNGEPRRRRRRSSAAV